MIREAAREISSIIFEFQMRNMFIGALLVGSVLFGINGCINKVDHESTKVENRNLRGKNVSLLKENMLLKNDMSFLESESAKLVQQTKLMNEQIEILNEENTVIRGDLYNVKLILDETYSKLSDVEEHNTVLVFQNEVLNDSILIQSNLIAESQRQIADMRNEVTNQAAIISSLEGYKRTHYISFFYIILASLGYMILFLKKVKFVNPEQFINLVKVKIRTVTSFFL